MNNIKKVFEKDLIFDVRLRTPVVENGSNCKLTVGAEQQTNESCFKNRRDNTPQHQQQQL